MAHMESDKYTSVSFTLVVFLSVVIYLPFSFHY